MLADIECVLAKEQVYVGKNTRKRAKKSFLCVLSPPAHRGRGEAEAVRRGVAPPCGGPDVRDQRK